ncbi:MAG: hypothetical protein KY476_15905 [Planctomycetes bacterium]|nr:hypothetical protein [Planctomycetota bacterium]
MAVFKSYRLLIAAIVVLPFAGCRALSSTPDKRIVKEFARIDALMISARPDPIEITDAATIQKLRQIYEQAKWEPFIDTMPHDTVSIKCMRNGQESFNLLFGAGWLIECEDERSPIRKAILEEGPRDWLYELTRQEH